MGHWYYRDGTSCYEVPAKKGGMKATTVREARELGLSPSVTTVLSIKAKPQFDVWKQKNAIMAALTLPRKENESLDDFADRVIMDANSVSKDAMGLGTLVHDAIEKTINKQYYDLARIEDDKQRRVVACAIDFVQSHEFVGKTEIGLANNLFAGKIDFAGSTKLCANEVLIDFKPPGTRPDRNVVIYKDMLYQLAAYRYLIGNPNLTCCNIIISTTEPGRIEAVYHDEADMKDALTMFWLLLGAFRLENKLGSLGPGELLVADNYNWEKYEPTKNA